MKLHLKASSTAHSDTASLRLNVVSGLTASAVVLPKAMAYATVAGLPVAVGLYTAFVPMLIYAFLVRLSRNEATSPKRCFTRALADALPI